MIELITASLGLLVYFQETYTIGVIASLILLICLLKSVKKLYGYFSLSFLFLILFLLYSYSVPISIILGLDVGEYRNNYISTWSEIDYSLCLFSFISHISIIGMSIALFWHSNNKRYTNIRNDQTFIIKSKQSIPLKNTFFLIFLSSITASIFEFINFIRIGGWTTLILGKLSYQSAYASKSLLLPSELAFYISAAIFGYGIASKKKPSKVWFKVCTFILGSSFMIFVNLFIGERGVIINTIFIGTLSACYGLIIRTIRPSILIALGALYLSFAFLTIYRYSFDKGVYDGFSKGIKYTIEHKDLVIFSLNPANSEFGTSALNFRVYKDRTPTLHFEDMKFGSTYLHFITQILPQKINPFYDVSETIKFRDTFFIERSEHGVSGGTAYSSIYEAYINFGTLGGGIVYYAMLSFILWMDHRRRLQLGGLFQRFFYPLYFFIILMFNRSASDYVITKTIYMSILLFIVSTLLKNLKK